MPKTVLLADDSVVIQKLVGLSFANEDLRLITTDNGDDALARTLEEKPDLVLADVVMPGKNGYEVCQAIKQHPELAHIPVLLLTGTFEAFDDERARQIGSAGHITKPFEAQGLVDRVQELLARSSAPATPPRSQVPQAGTPAAEPTMIVESDETYDFFDDDDGVDLATAEPMAEEPGTDLGVGGADEAFAFASDPTPNLAPKPTLGMHPADASGAPEPGGDSTVALVPDQRTPEAPPPIPEGPAAAPRPALDGDFETTAPSEARQAREAATPMSPPTLAAAPRSAGKPGFVTQDPPPLTSPPPVPVSEAAPTQIIQGFSLDTPPPLPTSADPGETILADDLFADARRLAPAPDEAGPKPEIRGSAEDEDLEFSFDAAASAAPPLTPPAMQPAAAPEPVEPVASDAPEPAAATDPVIESLETDRLAAPFNAERLHTSSSNDLLSAPLETEDFAADAGEDHDLLEPLSTEDASEFDVSSSDLGDPLGTSGPQPASETEMARHATEHVATPLSPRPAPTAPEITATPPEPEAKEAHPEAVPETPPAQATPTPDISPVMRQRIHEMLEKAAWEAFADLSDSVVRHVVKKVEEIAWEVVPQMAESLIREEIRRMKGEPGDPNE